jgi:hypothetical protein
MQRFMGSMVNGERLENILDDHKSACVTVANCHIRKGTSPLRPRSAAATGLGDGMKKCLHQDCTHYRHTPTHQCSSQIWALYSVCLCWPFPVLVL